MKKLLLFFLVFAVAGFVACKGGDSAAPGELSGVWKVDDSNDHLFFNRDGSYKVANRDGSGLEEEGKFVLADGVLTTTSASGRVRKQKIDSFSDKEIKTRRVRDSGEVSDRVMTLFRVE
jgi:hypothetical protein